MFGQLMGRVLFCKGAVRFRDPTRDPNLENYPSIEAWIKGFGCLGLAALGFDQLI